MLSRLEQNIEVVEDKVNSVYDLSKSPKEMTDILDGVFNELMYNRYLYNWKVNIDDIKNPEIMWRISRVDQIRIINIKKVERNNKIEEILNYGN